MTFTTTLQQFEGPLDLLLQLIEKEELDISEIALANVTDQYLQYIQKHEIQPKYISEFLVVASQLIVIKSRILIPSLEIPQDEQEDIDELTKRLEEYKRLKAVARQLRERSQTAYPMISRGTLLGTTQQFSPPKTLTTKHLQRIFEQLLIIIPTPVVLPKKIMNDFVSLEHRIHELHNQIQQHLQQSFSQVVQKNKGKEDVIVSFLAILELLKQQLIVVEQQQQFGEMIFKKT